jgi:hypothetical protein
VADDGVKQIFDSMEEQEKAWKVGQEAIAPKNPYGTVRMTDQEHVMWFEHMQSKDPLWPLALPFVEGGMTEVNRYQRTKGGG